MKVYLSVSLTVVASIGIGAVGAVGIGIVNGPEPVRCDPPDVVAIFDRLRPVVREGHGRYDSGLTIEFWSGGVEVTVKTGSSYRGDEYHGVGPDLRMAVDRLLGASDPIKNALEGWR